MDIKRNMKDSVFTSLFRDKKYVLQLYNALFPDSEEAVYEEDINIITLENVLMNAMYNDPGFMVKDKLIVLAEAQSTWSENIVVRMLLYVAGTYKEYIDEHKLNLYSSKNVKLPKPELFVIYSGDKDIQTDVISLADRYFGGEKVIDVNVKVLTGGTDNDIVYQYIRFTKVFNQQIKNYGYTEKAITETIRICKDENVLREYMSAHEKEVITMLSFLFDDEKLREAYEKELRDESMEKGRAEGIAKTTLSSIQAIMFSLKYTAEQAMEVLNVPQQDRAGYLAQMKES